MKQNTINDTFWKRIESISDLPDSEMEVYINTEKQGEFGIGERMLIINNVKIDNGEE